MQRTERSVGKVEPYTGAVLGADLLEQNPVRCMLTETFNNQLPSSSSEHVFRRLDSQPPPSYDSFVDTTSDSQCSGGSAASGPSQISDSSSPQLRSTSADVSVDQVDQQTNPASGQRVVHIKFRIPRERSFWFGLFLALQFFAVFGIVLISMYRASQSLCIDFVITLLLLLVVLLLAQVTCLQPGEPVIAGAQCGLAISAFLLCLAAVTEDCKYYYCTFNGGFLITFTVLTLLAGICYLVGWLFTSGKLRLMKIRFERIQ